MRNHLLPDPNIKMTNELIYLLTNRNDHQTPFLGNDGYTPAKSDHMVFVAADILRRKLKLHLNHSDWYWRAPLACMLSTPEYVGGLDNVITTSPRFWRPSYPIFTGGRAIGISDRPKLTWTPSELPDSFTFDLVYSATGDSTITHSGQTYKVRCKVHSGNILVPDLAVLMPGADFGIVLPTAPSDGVGISWVMEPTTYPFRNILDELESTPQLALLLASYTANESYATFPDDTRKLGLIASLIVRATKDHA